MAKATQHVQKQIRTAPQKPGVYTFLDSKGRILYIGKAKNIRARLKQHFLTADVRQARKQHLLIRLTQDITWTEAPSEKDALTMENQAIKTHTPPFNILFRDDKTYPYLKVSQSHNFPKLSLERRIQPGKDLYFGPFISGRQVRHMMDLCHVMFKIRSCSDTFFKTTKRPCLEYQLSRCKAPCVQYQSQSDYQAEVKQMCQFLEGKNTQILTQLRAELKSHVKQEAYLEAKIVHDRIQLIERFLHESQGTAFTGIEGHSDFWTHTEDALGVLHVRFGVVTGIQVFDASQRSLREQYALAFANYGTRLVPPTRIFISSQAPSPDSLKKSLAPHRIRLEIARTQKALSLIEYLTCEIEKKDHATRQAHQESRAQKHWLKDFCRLDRPAKLFECIDISHFQGQYTVGAVVVFDALGPLKQAYRTYLIRQSRLNDPSAIKEVCLRRYQKENFTRPDVLLIDGGKGQLNAAVKALSALNLDKEIRVLSIAKNRNEKYGGEKIYFPHQSKAVLLKANHPLYSFFCRLRDEAHRFSITQQRKRFQKQALQFSDLKDIPGLGPKRQEIVKSLLIAEGPTGILKHSHPPQGFPRPVWQHVRAWAKRFL